MAIRFTAFRSVSRVMDVQRPVDEPVGRQCCDSAAEDQATEVRFAKPFKCGAYCVRTRLEDILKDGCFLERAEIDRLLDRLS